MRRACRLYSWDRKRPLCRHLENGLTDFWVLSWILSDLLHRAEPLASLPRSATPSAAAFARVLSALQAALVAAENCGAEKGRTLGVVWPFLSGRDRRHGRCGVPWLETRDVTVIDCRDAHLVQRIW